MQYLTQHSIMLRELVATSRRVYKTNICPVDAPKFPIQTLEDFLEFDTKLSQSSHLAEYMVSRLSSVGGSGIESLTRRMLQFLISNEVAILYNWKGREKLSFEKTALMSIIYDAAKLNFPVSEKNDLIVANAVKVWLKFAKARMLHSKKKVKVSF